MIIVYIRIYIAATREINAIKIGHKRGSKKKSFSLRIHRGGYRGGYLSVKSESNTKEISKHQSYNVISHKSITQTDSFIMDDLQRNLSKTSSLPNLPSSKYT